MILRVRIDHGKTWNLKLEISRPGKFLKQFRLTSPGARCKYKTGLENTYSVSTGPVQFNATSRSHKHKNMADYQRNMLLSVLLNEIDSSLDTGQQLIHNISLK